MFSLETSINGMLIGHAHVVRKEAFDANQEVYTYHVTYLRPENPRVIRFYLKHRRTDGAEKLVFLIYQEIDKRLKKENHTRI